MQALAVIFPLAFGVDDLAHFLHAVAGVHHDLARAQQFAGDVRRAFAGATATLGTAVGVHQALPTEVEHILRSETIGHLVTGDGMRWRRRWRRNARIQHALHFTGDTLHVGDLGLRLQLAVPHVGEGQQDVQMLAVGQVIQERQDADDVEPPADAFDEDQCGRCSCGEVEQSRQRTADRKCACLHVMLRPLLLQRPVGGVHQQKGAHQSDLGEQDEIGIALRPSVQFLLNEAFQLDDVAAHQEDDAGHPNA